MVAHPLQDVADLYCSVADEQWSAATLEELATLHRERLEHHGAARVPSPAEWRRQLALVCFRFAAIRISGLAIVGSAETFAFLPRLLRNAATLMEYADGVLQAGE